MTTRRVLVLGLGVTALALCGAWLLAWHTHAAHPDVPVYNYLIEGSVSTPVVLAIATLLTMRRPDHRITWIVVGVAVAGSLQQLAGGWAHLALLGTSGRLPLGEAALFVSSIAQGSSVVLTILLVNLFPTGSPLTKRWRPLVWLTLATVALTATDPLFGAQPYGGGPDFPWFGDVSGLLHDRAPGFLVTPFVTFGTLGTGLMIIGTPIHAVVRFRRSQGVERAQLKWFALAFVGCVVFIATPWYIPPFSWTGLDNLPGWFAWTVGPTAIWVAVGLAILRYRLYDIDRVLSRTVSYALLTGVLVGVYALGVLGVGALLPGERSDLLVAGSTLAVAAAFRPLRSRIQAVVDRRFNRARYDAARTVEAFGSRLRDEVDLASLTAELRDVVEDTVRPQVAAVWLREVPT